MADHHDATVYSKSQEVTNESSSKDEGNHVTPSLNPAQDKFKVGTDTIEGTESFHGQNKEEKALALTLLKTPGESEVIEIMEYNDVFIDSCHIRGQTDITDSISESKSTMMCNTQEFTVPLGIETNNHQIKQSAAECSLVNPTCFDNQKEVKITMDNLLMDLIRNTLLSDGPGNSSTVDSNINKFPLIFDTALNKPNTSSKENKPAQDICVDLKNTTFTDQNMKLEKYSFSNELSSIKSSECEFKVDDGLNLQKNLFGSITITCDTAEKTCEFRVICSYKELIKGVDSGVPIKQSTSIVIDEIPPMKKIKWNLHSASTSFQANNSCKIIDNIVQSHQILKRTSAKSNYELKQALLFNNYTPDQSSKGKDLVLENIWTDIESHIDDSEKKYELMSFDKSMQVVPVPSTTVNMYCPTKSCRSIDVINEILPLKKNTLDLYSPTTSSIQVQNCNTVESSYVPKESSLCNNTNDQSNKGECLELVNIWSDIANETDDSIKNHELMIVDKGIQAEPSTSTADKMYCSIKPTTSIVIEEMSPMRISELNVHSAQINFEDKNCSDVDNIIISHQVLKETSAESNYEPKQSLLCNNAHDQSNKGECLVLENIWSDIESCIDDSIKKYELENVDKGILAVPSTTDKLYCPEKPSTCIFIDEISPMKRIKLDLSAPIIPQVNNCNTIESSYDQKESSLCNKTHDQSNKESCLELVNIWGDIENGTDESIKKHELMIVDKGIQAEPLTSTADKMYCSIKPSTSIVIEKISPININKFDFHSAPISFEDKICNNIDYTMQGDQVLEETSAESNYEQKQSLHYNNTPEQSNKGECLESENIWSDIESCIDDSIKKYELENVDIGIQAVPSTTDKLYCPTKPSTHNVIDEISPMKKIILDLNSAPIIPQVSNCNTIESSYDQKESSLCNKTHDQSNKESCLELVNIWGDIENGTDDSIKKHELMIVDKGIQAEPLTSTADKMYCSIKPSTSIVIEEMSPININKFDFHSAPISENCNNVDYTMQGDQVLEGSSAESNYEPKQSLLCNNTPDQSNKGECLESENNWSDIESCIDDSIKKYEHMKIDKGIQAVPSTAEKMCEAFFVNYEMNHAKRQLEFDSDSEDSEYTKRIKLTANEKPTDVPERIIYSKIPHELDEVSVNSSMFDELEEDKLIWSPEKFERDSIDLDQMVPLPHQEIAADSARGPIPYLPAPKKPNLRLGLSKTARLKPLHKSYDPEQ